MNIDQNDILSHLTHTGEWDDILAVSADKSAELRRTGYNQRKYHPGAYVKLDIFDEAQTAAVTDVDDFLSRILQIRI